MKAALLIFLGGGLGSVLRFGVYKFMQHLGYSFVYGTFAVNIIGSLILGFLLGYSLKEIQLPGNLLLFLATGFCGGFTTFSTFSAENQEFLRSGDYLSFSLYALGSLILGIIAVSVGLLLSKNI